MKSYSKRNIFKYNKKRDAVFLIFVLGTLLFWFLINLSKDYQQVVKYSVNYVSLPKEYVFQEEAPNEISLNIKANGFYLLGQNLSKKTINISVKNIKKKDKYNYYLTNENIVNQVNNLSNQKITVVNFVSDTLFLKLGKRSFKKVPVLPDITINYHPGFKSFFGYKIIPDSIGVSGPEMQVEKINKIALVPFKKEDVQVTINQNINVIQPKNSKIELSTDKINLQVEVEKITEKTIIVPIQVNNVSKEVEVVIYPKKVKVTGLVRLSEFNQIKPEDFLIVCDYKQKKDKHMVLELKQKPSNISKVKLSMDAVEYLILK